jgi:hypothetical protein
MNIKLLHVRGDSYLIVSQVKRDFASNKTRLIQHRDAIWDDMQFFDEFSIEVVPIERNFMTDALAMSASTLQPYEEIYPYKVEVNFRPPVPDNLEHWQFFDDENQICVSSRMRVNFQKLT